MAQRFEGRNVEEALAAATAALGVERYKLTHRVLLEKRGFLGGVKRVVIEAEVNADAAPPAPSAAPPAVVATPSADIAPAPGAPPAPRTRAAGRDRGGRERGGRGGRGRRDDRRHHDGGGRREPRAKSDDALRPGDFARFVDDIPAQTPESEAAKLVRDWCEELMDLARLNIEIRTEENDARIAVRVFGREAGRFLEHNGELLDAVQVLANKAFVGRKVEKDIELDCGDFKHKREEDLERRAREVADRVRAEGVEELLPAMSPIERRIVHVTLQDDADVTTESRGTGFFKRVAIVPRSAVASQP